jgi:hypothetical protein
MFPCVRDSRPLGQQAGIWGLDSRILVGHFDATDGGLAWLCSLWRLWLASVAWLRLLADLACGSEVVR